MEHNESIIVSTAFQCTGLALVTVLCVILLGTVRRPFLRYWTIGWACMTLSLASILAGFLSSEFAPASFSLYCFAEYCAGYYWLAGCRCRAYGAGPRRRELWLIVPALAAAVALPNLLRDVDGVLAVHMLLMAGLFGAAACTLVTAWRIKHSLGTAVVLTALMLLTVAFLQYPPTCGYSYWTGNKFAFPHMKYSALYDLMLEMVLAFGMVMVALETVRTELETANHELQSQVGFPYSMAAALSPRTQPS